MNPDEQLKPGVTGYINYFPGSESNLLLDFILDKQHLR